MILVLKTDFFASDFNFFLLFMPFVVEILSQYLQCDDRAIAAMKVMTD